MAIQISGTTVIDNSRNLTSIANATNANTASAFVQRDASGNFSAGTITAALTGNASSATTASACSGNSATATTASACSGNSATATTLATARTIGGVSFNGSASINLPGVDTAGNQNTSGNAATATTLATARTINGVSFNGSANIDANPTSGAFSNGQGARTIQSGGTASGGSNGDIFYIY